MFGTLGSSFSTLQYLSKIYNNPDFGKFIKTFNDNKKSHEVMSKFIRNVLATHIDPIIELDLKSEHNKNLFINNDLSNLEKSKILAGKIVKKYLHGMSMKLTAIPETTIVFDENMVKESILTFVIEQLNDIDELRNCKSPIEVYSTLLTYFANYITVVLFVVTTPLTWPIDETDFLNELCSLLGKFNTYYEYKGITNNDNNDNNDDSSSTTDPINNDDDVPNTLKRGRANEGLPKPDSNPNSDKKQKN